MGLIEVVRYFRTIKHPIGDGIYITIGLEFGNEVDADKFRIKELKWDEGIEVIEVSKEEYISETEEE